MLIDIKNKLRRSNRKNPELKITLGETIRDTIIKTGLEAAQESGYAAGNVTEKLVNVATSVGAKVVSSGCMTYRNLCAGEGC